MSFIMIMHSLAGSIVVFSGALALLLSKGSPQHKIAGQLFVGSTLLMGAIVAAQAWITPDSITSLGILFVVFIVYLVVSAWSTMHQPEGSLTGLDIAAPLIALCISIGGLIVGFDALGSTSETADLPPQEAYFFFSGLAFIAMLLDANNIKERGLRGKHRIVRHVWRMSFALFFATSTLFTGPGSIVFPESVRGSPILQVPQFLIFFLAAFWVCRLLFSKRRPLLKGINSAPESQNPSNSLTESK